VSYHPTAAQEPADTTPLGVEGPGEVGHDLDCVGSFKAVFQQGVEKSESETRELDIEAATYRRLGGQTWFTLVEDAPRIPDQAPYLSVSEPAILGVV